METRCRRCRFLCANNSGSTDSTPPRWPVPPNSRPCRSGVRSSLAFSFHLGRCGGAGAAVGRRLCCRRADARRHFSHTRRTPRPGPEGVALPGSGHRRAARQTTGKPTAATAAVGEPQQRRTTAGGPTPPAPTEPSGSLFQRSLPRQQQQDGGGAATAGCPRAPGPNRHRGGRSSASGMQEWQRWWSPRHRPRRRRTARGGHHGQRPSQPGSAGGVRRSGHRRRPHSRNSGQQRRWSPRPRPKRTPGREAAGPAIAAVQTGNSAPLRPPALRPVAATKATGFRRVSWVFFL